MSENNITPNTLSDRLKVARQEAGFESVQDASALLGLSANTLYSHEMGRRKPKEDALQRYATHYGVTIEWLLGEKEADKFNRMPIRGMVGAGSFTDDAGWEHEVKDYLPIRSDESYANITQFALQVSGDEFDTIYPQNSYVICIDIDDTEPRIGDHVIVQRERYSLFEKSIREVAIDNEGKPVLNCKSTNHRHEQSVPLTDSHKIIAVIIGKYSRVTRNGPSLKTV